jgi:hypothetical protein
MVSLYRVMWWSVISPHFYKKEVIKNVVKCVILLEVKSSNNLPKQKTYIYSQIFINYYFNFEVKFEK